MNIEENLELLEVDKTLLLDGRGQIFLNNLMNESRSAYETAKYVLTFLKILILEFE